MPDFVQLNVKRRQTKIGLLDLLFEMQTASSSSHASNRLRQRVESWLIEDKVLRDPPQVTDTVSPSQIEATTFNRICEIAGHAWLEYVKDANEKDIQTPPDSPLNRHNMYLAEFIPEFDYDRALEVLSDADGGPVLWSRVTGGQLEYLFAPLVKPSFPIPIKSPKSTRSPGGAVPGELNVLSPDKIQEYPRKWIEDWFEKPNADRANAFITPVWEVTLSKDDFEPVKPFYSFTPEHYNNAADNCITWAARVLDRLAGDWLTTILTQCGLPPPQCHLPLAPTVCDPYHIRQQGRVKCLVLSASGADGARMGGLKKFT